MPLGMEVGLGQGDYVLDGDPAPSPQKFSAHVYCGQTAGWIKMALSMEVGLGSGHIVLHGDTAPLSKKGQSPPQVSAHFIVLCTEVGLGLRGIVLDGDPAPLP